MSRWPRSTPEVARVLGAIVALVGALIVLGWALGEIIVPSAVAAAPAVKLNTGIGFMLGGVALTLAGGERAIVLTSVLAAGVTAIGLLTLIEYVFGTDLGIDQLLFDDGSISAGRMAPNTALALALCGAALLLRRGHLGRWRPAEALAVVGALIGWLVLIGFASGLQELVQLGSFLQMALPTAICFVLLGAGIALTVPGGWLAGLVASGGPAGPLVRRLLLAVVAVPPLVSLALRAAHSSGALDGGAVILLLIASIALTLLTVALSFARSLDTAESKRLRAQEDLRASERRHREVIEVALDGFVAMDARGVITAWNPAAEALFGWSAPEATGRTVAETIVPEELRGRHRTGLARVAAGGASTVIGERVELQAVRRDGRRIPVELSISFSEGEDGRRFHAFVHDISERRAAEAERERQNAELERSNAELAEFAYVASHDLQEPLRVIGGFVELLRQRYHGELDDDADRFIAATVSGVERMRALIDDLLRYSHVGRAQVRREPVDTGATVGEVLERLREPIAERDVEVELGPLPVVRADPNLIEQLFANLVSNAVKFSAGERPRVEISGVEENGGWHFTVADNGPGIEERYRERIFEMFKRLHGRSVPGTGIGLAICKRAAERHGGRIWVESEPGTGSTFHFTIGR